VQGFCAVLAAIWLLLAATMTLPVRNKST
jgi:hypothetical protein